MATTITSAAGTPANDRTGAELPEVTRSGARATSRLDRGSPVAPGVALLVAVLAFLPIVNWMPEGYKFPEYASKLVQWASGTGIAVGAGIVLTILARQARWLWPGDAVNRLGARIEPAPWRAVFTTAVLAGALYLSVSHWIFHGRPLLIDEIVEARQAQIFAAGHLWLPTPPHPEFFSSLHMVDVGGRVYSQFPPGGPALLALGVLAGATWLVVPLCAVLSVVAFAVIVRVAEPNVSIAVAAVVLFAVAPFTVFMSGSYMNHVTALTCILVAGAALVQATARPGAEGGRPGLAFVSGLGFGAAATIRPVDALAFAAPAALWYTWRVLHTPRRWVDAVAALVGVAIPMSAMFYVNAHTTGAALLFGYQVLWGKDHDLGFHQAPWGGMHTPGRGLELINLYFLRLQDYLFETPVPALVPAIGALALTKRLRPVDRYLLASCGLVTILYFAYWADGNYLGPRFVYTFGPVAALWTARFPTLLRDWLRRSRLKTVASTFVYRVSMYGLATSAAVAVCVGITFRAEQYRHNFATERWATPEVASQSGVRNALVFVREGWVEQLVARLWALGVSHPHVETLYRAVDPCRLDSAVTALERNTSGAQRTDATLYAMLSPLLRDSAAVEVVHVGLGGVKQLHMQRGYPYPMHCLRRVDEIVAGISPLAPLLAVGGSDGNVYARDLHARDTLLLAEYADRPIYVVHPTSPLPSGLPAFFPVSRDSLLRAWRQDARADSAPTFMRRILVPAQPASPSRATDSMDTTPHT